MRAGLAWALHGPAFIRGATAGLLAMAAFLSLHAVLVRPIWIVGLARGIPVAVLGGGLVGVVYDRARGATRRAGLAGAALFGLCFAAVPVPFAAAGAARTAGQGPAGILAVLGPLAAAAATFVIWSVQAPREPLAAARRRLGEVGAATVALNAYPAGFLLVLDNIVEDHVPNPWPMVIVLGSVYLGAALLVEVLSRRAWPWSARATPTAPSTTAAAGSSASSSSPGARTPGGTRPGPGTR